MTIPIYSNLKAKLEAKGLDARTSGQIAWFVCSFLYPVLLYYPSVFFINFITGNLEKLFYNFVESLGFIVFLSFILNLFYFRNAIVCVLSFLITSFVILGSKLTIISFYFLSCCVLIVLLLVCCINRKFIINVFLSLVGYTFSCIFFTIIYSLSR